MFIVSIRVMLVNTGFVNKESVYIPERQLFVRVISVEMQ